jgi:hypothetical protein
MDRRFASELGKARRLLEQASIILERLVEGLESDAPENADEPLQAIIAAIDGIRALEDEGDEEQAPRQGTMTTRPSKRT